MGLFIVAGILAIIGFVFLIIRKFYNEIWVDIMSFTLLITAGSMLFILLMIMGSNRGSDIQSDLKDDYVILTLALEEADSLYDYYIIFPQVEAYNNKVEQHKRNRQNKWTSWLFSPKVAELPLIDIEQYETGG